MSVRVLDVLMRELGTLRYEPTEKRIRGLLGDATVIDSTRAVLVWEPKRVVPAYGFRLEDIDGDVVAAPPTEGPEATSTGVRSVGAPKLDGRVVYDPSVPFGVHTTPGEPVTISTRSGGQEASAFRPDDPALAGHLVVDFDAFDAWYEEDEPNVGHPRDPFHRIDIVRSRRHVRVELEGEVVAESSDSYLLFEPPLPVRYYLPPEDVRTDLLRPSPTRSVCAYKGRASYWSLAAAGNLAWSYPEPLREAAVVTDRVAFFNEHVDIVIDGTVLPRPQTPWSRR